MRTIGSDLLTAQRLAARRPYILLEFVSYDDATTYTYSSDLGRIKLIDHTESPFGQDDAGNLYGDKATIILANEDRTIPDMQGYRVSIGYGDILADDSNLSSQTPTLWVKHQQTVSAQGKLYEVIELEGMWLWLHEQLLRLGDPPLYQYDGFTDGVKTVYEIIQYIISQYPGWSLLPLAASDGIIDVYKPVFYVNQSPFESAAIILSALINMTKCYIRLKGWRILEIVYPLSTDTPDVTYDWENGPDYWYQYMDRRNVVIPNQLLVFANNTKDGPGGGWNPDTMITGVLANDADSQAQYGVVTEVNLAPYITTQTDADNYASALLSQAQASNIKGKLILPHDARIELYDYVEVVDSR